MANIYETNPSQRTANQKNPTGSAIGKYYTRIRLGEYKRPNPFREMEVSDRLIVYLPLPDQLVDNTTVKYSETNLEAVGDFINNPIESGPTLLFRRAGAAIESGASGLGGSATTAMTGSSTAGDFMQKQISSIMPAEKINSAIQQEMGMAPNPNPSVMFQGPSLRSFVFSWSFYPKSAQESQDISNLILKLKARALPTFNKGTNTTVLNYPYMCQLNFFPWDAGGTGAFHWSPKSIIKIKKCFMDSVSVKYNPFGTPAFFEGTNLPISYQLTISFKEIEYMTGRDWDPAYAREANTIYGEFNAGTALLGIASTIVGNGATAAAGAVKEIGDFINIGVSAFTGVGEVPLTQEQQARVTSNNEAITKLRPNESVGFFNSETGIYVEFSPSTETPGGYVVKQYNRPDVERNPDGTVRIISLNGLGSTSYRTDAREAIEQATESGLLTTNSIKIESGQ